MTTVLLVLLLQTAPPGWKVEELLRPPKLRHPSVVCCAPDGRVFVAEDPMDVSAPADATQGRILCLHPDGRLTVFAENLHAVFGMQYLEGKLYVLHNPQYTRFADGGDAGRDRTDLIACTHPKPWAHDWNDHVPANFKLGMDGRFLVAVGDKGLFGAVGTDGSRAELRGGGILRMTPDAAGLEVVASGVRNILDVALDAEDEAFTYDNTDEHHWMGRVAHMVEGGYYGYPWDFHPRRPDILWPLADFGAGAATGATFYDGDVLPPALFLADFGKRSVARVRLARDGASFKLVSREEFLGDPDGAANFRPVGIAWAPDGRSLYVCDWNHADTKAKKPAGRLFRVSWTGPEPGTPVPPWWVAAASGRPFEASSDALAAALRHPSRAVRLTAQRRLAERADGAAERVAADAAAPPLARVHALWASRSALPFARDPDPRVRRQALRALALRRDREAGPLLTADLKHADAAVRLQAAIGLGRLGDASAVPALLDALDEKDAVVRHAAFRALHRLGAWTPILRGLADERPAVREGALFALRGAYAKEVVEALAAFVDGPRPERAFAASLLGELRRKDPPWDGAWWSNPYHPALSPRPDRTVDWEGTPAALDALRRGLAHADPAVRRACADGLREAAELPKLRDRYAAEADVDVRRSLLRSFAALKDAGARPLLAGALTDPALRAEALAAAEALKDAALILPLLAEADVEVRRAAIASLGALKAKEAIPALVEAFGRDDTKFEAADALSRMPDLRALDAYAYGLASANGPLRERCEKAVADLRKRHPAETARLKTGPARAADPQAYLDFAVKPRGDAARGRALFADPKGPGCLKCHKVAGEGGEVGPDLSAVGGQFSRAELAESLLFPSRKVREGYGQVRIRTKSGDVLAGAVKEETPDQLTLMDAEGRRHILRTADIESRQASELSLMPEGLERGLSMQDVADLVSYLESLKPRRP